MMRKITRKTILNICGVAIFHLMASDLFAATEEPQKNPNPAKGCAICHYRWIDTFFIEGKGTDLVPYQSEKVAATPEMCMSCHDGSIMDSRARTLHGNAHKTDAKPPSDMTIPDIFPLDENGKVQCATCHTAHGVESGPDVKETIFLRTSNKNSAMCSMCHPDKDGGKNTGNHSLGKSERMIPQDLKMRGAHEGSEKNQMICETCHTAHGAKAEGYLVQAVGNSRLCIGCHGEMDMFDRTGKRNANHAINVKPQIATIEETLHQKGAKLGYNGVITCQTCHKIHNNKIEQPMLLLEDNRQSDICLTCHPDKSRLTNTKHNLSLSAREEKNLEGETTSESGMCSACHLPHKAARKPYMKTADTDRTTSLCLSCHAQGMFAENKKLSGYLHPVGVAFSPISGTGTKLDLPLYNKLGVLDEKGEITCATCHDTHGGTIIQEVSNKETGELTKKTILLRKASPEICRSCHAEKFAIENTRHDLNRVFPKENPIMKERITESDVCLNCHRIHSIEKEGYIWQKKIITDSGQSVIDMCTDCHDKNGLAPDMRVQGNSHPVNIFLTNQAKSTQLPLFNVSEKKTENGIMTCSTCHDPHRWSSRKPSLDKRSTPEDRPLNPFLRIDAAPSSDLCVNCHEKEKDARNADHNLVVTAPDAKNSQGRTPKESGVCGACHLVHNSKEKIELWARDLGQGDNITESMCKSCHSKNGAASTKIPQVSTHPETYFISGRKFARTDFPSLPLYDQKTAQLISTGNITCLSCHDAHRWSMVSENKSSYVNREGSVTTSFLRPHLADGVCKACHGFDGLYLFKYFHKAEKRKK